MRGAAGNAPALDDLLKLRQAGQGLAGASFRKPEDVVAWFGALQAQDHPGALWAIGQRLRVATEAQVEDAETRRAIVRTWPLRGTLHFVAARDARWMTQLLAPRVIARHAARWQREFGVDPALVARADEILTRGLEGGKRLTRGQIYSLLEVHRIRTGASRGLQLLLCLALRGRVCLAGRVGKQPAFALLDDWLPATPPLARDAALAELATRYFTAHGPATRRDFAWWSGLTAADAALAIDGAGRRLQREAYAGQTWWRGPTRRARGTVDSPGVRLLPAYDEYTVGYADRSMLVEPRGRTGARGMGLLSPVVLLEGRVVGTWKRTLEGRHVRIDARLGRRLSRAQAGALRRAAADYGRFLGRATRLHVR